MDAYRKTEPLVVRLLVLQAIIGSAAMGLLCWELGWPISEQAATYSEWATWALVVLALISEAGLAWRGSRQSWIKRYLILGALIALAFGRLGLERPLRDWLGTHTSPRSAALGALLVVQITLVIPFALRMLRLTRARALQSVRPGGLFVGSFLAAIVIGTLMLKTPQATVLHTLPRLFLRGPASLLRNPFRHPRLLTHFYLGGVLLVESRWKVEAARAIKPAAHWDVVVRTALASR